MNNSFMFIGNPVIPKPTAKRPFFSAKKNNSVGLFFGVKQDENNIAFVESFGAAKDEIYSVTKSDSKSITIAWENRNDTEVIDEIAYFRRFIVDLGQDHGGRCDFITEYDLIHHLSQHLPDVKQRIRVVGQFKKEWYSGKYRNRFQIQRVFLAAEDEPNQLSLTVDTYYNRDSLELLEDGKYLLNGFTPQYVSKDLGVRYFPHQFVFSTAEYSPENTIDQELMAYRMDFLQTDSESFVHIPWEISLFSGAEEIPFDESMLTEPQRMQIRLGRKTVEDFKPNGRIYGANTIEYRLVDPYLKGEFSDGLVDTGMLPQDLDKLKFTPETADEDIPMDISEDDLFGGSN